MPFDFSRDDLGVPFGLSRNHLGVPLDLSRQIASPRRFLGCGRYCQKAQCEGATHVPVNTSH
jgi:hypothetical protein